MKIEKSIQKIKDENIGFRFGIAYVQILCKLGYSDALRLINIMVRRNIISKTRNMYILCDDVRNSTETRK